MANTEAEPLLSGLEDLESQKFRRQLEKRTFHRARSSPDTIGNIRVLEGEEICMANTEATTPLLSGSEDPETQKFRRQLEKTTFRRAKSAPCSYVYSLDTNGNIPETISESIFGNIHPSFRKVAVYLILYLGIGTVVFYLVRDQMKGLKTNGVLDAIYFTVATLTTAGYGDIVPNSNLTKLLVCAFVFSRTAFFALILDKAADYLVEKQEVFLVKAMHMRQDVSQREILKEAEENKARYKFLFAFFLLLIIITVGTVFLAVFEKFTVIEAFYCVCSTLTLGYDGESFSSVAGRIFAVFWILAGTISLGQVFLYVADLNTERRQKAILKWVLSRKMTISDLLEADIENNGFVGASAFVIYKLKEMGKISQEDILPLMQKFKELDVDGCGKLTLSNLFNDWNN